MKRKWSSMCTQWDSPTSSFFDGKNLESVAWNCNDKWKQDIDSNFSRSSSTWQWNLSFSHHGILVNSRYTALALLRASGLRAFVVDRSCSCLFLSLCSSSLQGGWSMVQLKSIGKRLGVLICWMQVEWHCFCGCSCHWNLYSTGHGTIVMFLSMNHGVRSPWRMTTLLVAGLAKLVAQGFSFLHQGISCPSQAKNFPLSLMLTLLMIPRSFSTEYSRVKSFPSGTLRWNGLERSVFTVPGWSSMQTMGSFFLPNSTDAVFITARTNVFNNVLLCYIIRSTNVHFQIFKSAYIPRKIHLNDDTKSKAEPQQTISLKSLQRLIRGMIVHKH